LIAVAERGTSSLSYQFRFENAGRLVATGKVVVVRCLMRQDQKPLPVRIPEGILELMKSYQLLGQSSLPGSSWYPTSLV
jgi:acyl-CoA thioesterase FadM